MTAPRQHDLIIVGGGIGGIICLYYAKRAGLDVLLLEKQRRVGGLWARLPAWQEIQFGMQDWTLGEVPLRGIRQDDIAKNIEAWVDTFDLASHIRLGTHVVRASEAEGGWSVVAAGETHACRTLVCATGCENIPSIPPVVREGVTAQEFHSSLFTAPSLLAGRDVVVVGGGASALDLLELALAHGANRVSWVYRSTKWMVPTTRPKQETTRLRANARRLMHGETVEQLNAELNAELETLYHRFRIEAIKPDVAFDLRQDQLIPGRPIVIEKFDRIRRYPGDVRAITGDVAELSTGERVRADVVLWGTGFQLDLGFFASPAIASIRSLDALARRCGPLFKSADAPNLYFLAVVLAGATLTQWAYAHACRSIVAELKGEGAPGATGFRMHSNEIELIRALAAHDARNFPPGAWEPEYRQLLQADAEQAPLPIPR